MASAKVRDPGLPRDFGWLWAGQAISEWGTQLTTLALPTLAIMSLSASTFQVGLLVTLENLATPVLGLLVGVYIDRVRRRPVLIAADLGRLVVLAAVVALYASDRLRLGHLYVTSALLGVFTVFFTVGYHAYVPSLVGRNHLVRANTRLEISSSGALLVGPASAGLLIRAFGNAVTIGIDAVSYAVSALATLMIRKAESPPTREDRSASSMRADIAAGWRFVWATPVLRALTVANALGNLGFSMVLAILTVFAYRTLHLSPADLGIILTLASAGFLVSAAMAGRAAQRFGAGRSLLLANSLFAVGLLVTPMATVGYGAAVLFVGQLCVNLSLPWYNIISQSMQQSHTPDEVMGRVYASMRTLVWGATPVGTFLGGLLGQFIGVTWTLALGGVAAALANIPLLTGRLTAIRAVAPALATPAQTTPAQTTPESEQDPDDATIRRS